MSNGSPRDVVIVGGGFAGVAAARALGRRGLDVVLVDQNPYNQFQPLLYQAATAQIAVSSIARPLRSLFRRSRTVEVRSAEVTGIDPQNRAVTTADGSSYHGRFLVIASGAEANFFGIPGAEEHALPLYSLQDATALASRLLGLLDGADAAEESSGLSVVVIGAGPTGVETAGAIAETFEFVVPAYYSPRLAAACRVHLVDLVPTVLPQFSVPSQEYAHAALEKRGVALTLGNRVTEVAADSVVFADGTSIPSSAVVWAGGLKGGMVLASSGLPLGRGGRVDVQPDLTAPGFEGVYALGDAANIVLDGTSALPQLGSVAEQSGKWAARNILADIAGESRAPFRYRDKGIMAMVGRGAAVAEVGKRRLRLPGPLAFVAWLGVHAALLPGARQRLGALIAWGWDYLTHVRPHVVVFRPEEYWRGRHDADTQHP